MSEEGALSNSSSLDKTLEWVNLLTGGTGLGMANKDIVCRIFDFSPQGFLNLVVSNPKLLGLAVTFFRSDVGEYLDRRFQTRVGQVTLDQRSGVKTQWSRIVLDSAAADKRALFNIIFHGGGSVVFADPLMYETLLYTFFGRGYSPSLSSPVLYRLYDQNHVVKLDAKQHYETYTPQYPESKAAPPSMAVTSLSSSQANIFMHHPDVWRTNSVYMARHLIRGKKIPVLSAPSFVAMVRMYSGYKHKLSFFAKEITTALLFGYIVSIEGDRVYLMPDPDKKQGPINPHLLVDELEHETVLGFCTKACYAEARERFFMLQRAIVEHSKEVALSLFNPDKFYSFVELFEEILGKGNAKKFIEHFYSKLTPAALSRIEADEFNIHSFKDICHFLHLAQLFKSVYGCNDAILVDVRWNVLVSNPELSVCLVILLATGAGVDDSLIDFLQAHPKIIKAIIYADDHGITIDGSLLTSLGVNGDLKSALSILNLIDLSADQIVVDKVIISPVVQRAIIAVHAAKIPINAALLDNLCGDKQLSLAIDLIEKHAKEKLPGVLAQLQQNSGLKMAIVYLFEKKRINPTKDVVEALVAQPKLVTILNVLRERNLVISADLMRFLMEVSKSGAKSDSKAKTPIDSLGEFEAVLKILLMLANKKPESIPPPKSAKTLFFSHQFVAGLQSKDAEHAAKITKFLQVPPKPGGTKDALHQLHQSLQKKGLIGAVHIQGSSSTRGY